MKILMVNKFLYPNGGSETYIFKIGECLQRLGHEVQYFGMQDERNIVGNQVGKYTTNMNFHTGRLQKLIYPFKIIYSRDARNKIREVIKAFQPDIVHLNNFNFQLTPSIIYEIRNNKIPIIFTAHDYQMVCPNHMLRSGNQNCEKCISGKYYKCIKNKCIHKSKIKSILGSVEGYLYKWLGTYKYIDRIICPSRFIEQKLSINKALAGRTIVLHNFVDLEQDGFSQKENYVLYFGRYSKEKGIETLVSVCKKMPNINFVFVGKGPLEKKIVGPNIRNLGFIQGEELHELIGKAKFSIYPSEWYENCPFSILESIRYGTPVIGANIGGIPELIQAGKTGEIFESGNVEDLGVKILKLWNDIEENEIYIKNCRETQFDGVVDYCNKLLQIYREIM